MSDSTKLEIERYISDERDITFYLMKAGSKINTSILTGYILSCKFTAQGESDINATVALYSGDGRGHIPITTAQVASAKEWTIFITGTDGAGVPITPVAGSLSVVAQ